MIQFSVLFREQRLGEMAVYYFDGEGKFIRPRLAITMANAVNNHLQVRAGAGHHHGKRHQQSPPGESRGWPLPWQTPSTITSR
jgi:geranylgeranyl pyrophosphate synthase